ncbi:hypothetical protein ACTXT7_007412 [Hymenolepis weldensis]
MVVSILSGDYGHMENDRQYSKQNDCKRIGKMRQSMEQLTITLEENENLGGLATLLKEERTPMLGTLPLATTPPRATEVKRIPFSGRCIKAFQNAINRTFTQNWKLQKFPRTQKELSISSVIENIGRVMHPVEIVLTMHSRLDLGEFAEIRGVIDDCGPQIPELKSGT